MGFVWTGPNPTLPAPYGPWPGSLDWNEPRNWNYQNPALGPVYFPQDGDDAGFDFSPPGTISGTIAFQNCSAGSLVGASVEVKLSGVNCLHGYLNATAGAEIDVVQGGGVLTSNMQGGNSGSSGTITGCVWTIDAATLGGGLGSNLFQNFNNVVFKHVNPGGIAAIMGAISGFSPLQVGQKNPPIGQYTGMNAQLDVFGGGTFTGGVTSEYPYGFTTTLPKLNLKNTAAAGAAGQPINVRGGSVTFTAPAWLGHPLVLEVGGLIGPGPGSPYGVPMVVYLPDAREAGIKNSGASWYVKCDVELHQFSGGEGNVNGFAGIDDTILVSALGSLRTLGVRKKHLYGKLSFETGGKVVF